jgi:hypothetical protein
MDRDTQLAQLAYRAHNAALSAQSQMPPWEELPPVVQTAWEITAAAIRRSLQGTVRPAR